MPGIDADWLAAYSDSLFELLSYYGMQLIGGDTYAWAAQYDADHSRVWSPEGRALKRSGARIGDWIYVTGTLGDSAAGLAVLQDKLQMSESDDRQWLLQRHLRPQPRILHGQALRDLASAAIDLSDGLVSDLGHILKASDCGARVNLDALPYSSALLQCDDPEQAMRWALSGGEDYELCFTVPELNRGALEVAIGHLGARYTCIGQIAPASEGLGFFHSGQPVTVNLKGYDHFGS